ncbi:hypothetical protein [Gluconobacter sphaericus]|uniref:Uncharacterized protein n=1 Tax=Gluconobacter sphaericus NBRC 12467 TaxID=1307951 RepID=A0AA37SGZ4_9PROT|nr:hypothetical protein [Gluconobacter sphaericus]MBF0885547.1 hypothetical protein [Gluconobacter sphaericus]GBR56516.1 hypothetical protein AA12467_2651 [Gluconobacter sphaericus NBRC 12467]GEB42785.1 hypothetical protein GSP01_15670 [Gluconobacter sphaericus NBRC 12467]GLQ84761.1 hypothetical protein GCM10007872_16690 [Gluconobacter sphaericus NBRC 12467]GLQ85084.1 hypothetical protein GCM10007872_19920 [Gluconobacter sphaericus NBRC 12467]
MESRDIGLDVAPEGFEYELSQDKKSVKVGVQTGAIPIWSRDLNKDEITSLIWYLGRARAELEKAEGPPLPPEQQLARVINDPRWFSTLAPDKGGSLFIFNHPSFGALGFVTPLKWAATLARLLITQIEATLPGPDTKTDTSDQEDTSK